VIVGQVSLGNCIFFEQPLVSQCEKSNGKHPHAGAIAGVPLVKWRFQHSFQHEVPDAAPAGIAYIDRFRLQPCGKILRDCLQRPAVRGVQSRCDAEGHLRIVRHLSRLQVQPSASHDFFQAAVSGAYLSGGHELEGRAQSVAQGKANKSRLCALPDILYIDGYGHARHSCNKHSVPLML